MAKKNKLSKALKSDPKLRAKFFANLAETAAEAGIGVEDLRDDDALSFLGDITAADLPGGGSTQIVIISKSDSDKNTTSIIVGGKGVLQAMKAARDLDQ